MFSLPVNRVFANRPGIGWLRGFAFFLLAALFMVLFQHPQPIGVPFLLMFFSRWFPEGRTVVEVGGRTLESHATTSAGPRDKQKEGM